MSPEHWKRLEALYDGAANLAPEERARFIAAECGDDENLRRQLLAMFQDEGSGFTGVVQEAAAAASASPENSWSGRRMGPYRIERLLGRGGMGAVYLAVRDDDQFRKQVAIKTLKFDPEDPFALSRFRHERQILAHLEHPNIARLLDGGTTEQGTPYIVLEYVAGLPITAYCDEHQLSIDQRLRLFREVCEAVQYAHRNLVVHRDIKPGNILVTAEGVPKLLDFGIAKLLDPAAIAGVETRAATATGLQLMTPDYASPEQVRGETISTATDVYSLGAVLYQMLTGERPHRLQKYDTQEIARVICETEVRLPSTWGNRKLRGDLDTIVLKAMRKEPARRYSSVEQFSEDIRRHLEGLTVSARPDTTAYRVRKFVRRHRYGVGAAAAVAVALAAGIAVSVHEARIAERRFAQVRELADRFLFEFYDQVTPLPGSTKVRASIVEVARKYLDGLSKEAGNDKALIFELAQAYERLASVQSRTGTANLGQLDDARQNYQRAVDLYARIPVTRESSEADRRRLAGLLLSRSRLEYNAFRENAAELFVVRMLNLLPEQSTDRATRFLRARGELGLGEIREKQGRTAEALALMESARRKLQDLKAAAYRPKDVEAELQSTAQHLAHAKAQSGDLDGALDIFNELLNGSEPCADTGPPGDACHTMAVRLSWTGDVYAAVDRPNLGEPEKAAALYQRALDIQERIAALDAHDRQARFDLAARYGKLGDAVRRADPRRALALYGRALATAQSLVSKEQVEALKGSYFIAIVRPLTQLGRTAEARHALEEIKKLEEVPRDSKVLADLLGEIDVHELEVPLLSLEARQAEAKHVLQAVISETEQLRAKYPKEFTPVFFLARLYRELASFCTGEERRQAFRESAAEWHAWPETSFTKREELKDLNAARQ